MYEEKYFSIWYFLINQRIIEDDVFEVDRRSVMTKISAFKIESDAFITRSYISWYCIHHFRQNIHQSFSPQKNPIPSLGGELWGIFVMIWDRIYRVITALHCMKLLHMRFYMQCLPTFAKQWIVYLYWIAHFRPISHNNTNTCTVIMWCNHCIMASCNGNIFRFLWSAPE